MSFFSSLRRFAAEWSEAREMARTERMISGMPTELRKDIGWPSRYRLRHGQAAR